MCRDHLRPRGPGGRRAVDKCFQYKPRRGDNPEWEHVSCAAQLAANTSMRGVEVKHVRRKDFDPEKRVIHIRASKNETSKRVIPLNESAFDAVQRMVKRADTLGHTERTTICGAQSASQARSCEALSEVGYRVAGIT
jgi:integrase